MLMYCRIHGDPVLGRYTIECECGFKLSGLGESALHTRYSPLMAIADACAHFRFAHQGDQPDFRFSPSLFAWMHSYWVAATNARLDATSRPRG